MYYTYILKCKDDTYYTGYTNDLSKRIKNHNAGKGAKYTRGRGPVKLIYYEEFDNKQSAMRREWEIKQLPRSKKEDMSLQWKKKQQDGCQENDCLDKETQETKEEKENEQE